MQPLSWPKMQFLDYNKLSLALVQMASAIITHDADSGCVWILMTSAITHDTDTGFVWILMTSAITHDTDTGCVWILMTSAITHEHRHWLCMDTNDQCDNP